MSVKQVHQHMHEVISTLPTWHACCWAQWVLDWYLLMERSSLGLSNDPSKGHHSHDGYGNGASLKHHIDYDENSAPSGMQYRGPASKHFLSHRNMKLGRVKRAILLTPRPLQLVDL